MAGSTGDQHRRRPEWTTALAAVRGRAHLAPAQVIRLRHAPVSVGVARRRVRADLTELGLAGPAVDDVEMVVSELLGNSVRHARPISGGILLLGWRAEAGEVHLRVTDGGSPRRIEPCADDPMADSGRGLQIVERLALAWGVIDHAGGLTSVWAVLAGAAHPGPERAAVPILRLVR